jgi:hypothetical protein
MSLYLFILLEVERVEISILTATKSTSRIFYDVSFVAEKSFGAVKNSEYDAQQGERTLRKHSRTVAKNNLVTSSHWNCDTLSDSYALSEKVNKHPFSPFIDILGRPEL